MDGSENSRASQGVQWVTLERAAVLARSVMPRTLSLEAVKGTLRCLAADETLRCRDPRTGRLVVPRLDVMTYGNPHPEPFPRVEIEVHSLRRYLLHLHTEERWSLPVEDILNLGNEDVDPEEVLDRRLLAVASAEAAPVERNESGNVSDAVAIANAGVDAPEVRRAGRPPAHFKPEVAFRVACRMSLTTVPDIDAAGKHIEDVLAAKDWNLDPKTIRAWRQEFLGWFTSEQESN